jgi:hypothetical protein
MTTKTAKSPSNWRDPKYRVNPAKAYWPYDASFRKKMGLPLIKLEEVDTAKPGGTGPYRMD